MNTKTPTLDILNQLSATTSRNAKIDILKSNIDNTTLKRVLYAALDPYAVYNIRKIPKYTPSEDGFDIHTFIDHLPMFSDRIVTGNEAIQRMTELLTSLNPKDAVVAERVLKQDLRCGVQASTINKVWGNFIPTYPCLLGKSLDDKSILNIQYPAYAQLKLDGMRVNIFVDIESGKVEYRGRSGKYIDIHGALDDDFLDLTGKSMVRFTHVFDGEMVMVDTNGNVMPRKKGNGILNKAIKGTMSVEEASRVRVVLWDGLPRRDFLAKKCDTEYHARFDALVKQVGMYTGDKISRVESKEVNSFDEAMDFYKEVRKRKEEGIMLKNRDHLWEDKRSKHIIKIKAEEEADLEVIGWNPGTPGTKNEDKVGSLICATHDRLLEVGISGFSDELRDEITKDIQGWIGRIITVKYNEIIDSESNPGIKSLFLPSFTELREDKQVANMLTELK